MGTTAIVVALVMEMVMCMMQTCTLMVGGVGKAGVIDEWMGAIDCGR